MGDNERGVEAARPLLLVVAAIAVREGRVLLTLRGAGTHLAGHWEFPGGKVEPGEEPPAALGRELQEELGVTADVGGPFAFNYHAYPDRRVLLLTYLVTLHGEPRPLGCERVGWFTLPEIAALPLPPADAPILERLQGSGPI